MDLAIVQRLICPNPHAMTPLVVRADRAEHGRMQQGMLGCPVCGGEWNVTDGSAHFGDRPALRTPANTDATTIAALLGLTEAQLIVVDGACADVCSELAMAYDAQVVTLDSEESVPAATQIEGARIVPLASGIAGGVALLRGDRNQEFVESAVQCLVPDGRVVCEVSIPVPTSIREIARNDVFWVGERGPLVVTVPLRRRT